jgi:hypothetical protein
MAARERTALSPVQSSLDDGEMILLLATDSLVLLTVSHTLHSLSARRRNWAFGPVASDRRDLLLSQLETARCTSPWSSTATRVGWPAEDYRISSVKRLAWQAAGGTETRC